MNYEKQPAEMSQQELLAQALEISEHRAQPYVSEERKAQLGIKLNRLLFEYKYQQGEYGNGNDAA